MCFCLLVRCFFERCKTCSRRFSFDFLFLRWPTWTSLIHRKYVGFSEWGPFGCKALCVLKRLWKTTFLIYVLVFLRGMFRYVFDIVPWCRFLMFFMTFWLHFGDFWTPKCTSFCTCGAKGPPKGTDGAIWRQNGVQKVPNGAPKVPKWSPKVPNGAQRCQHGVKKAAQRAQMIPKVLTCGQIVRHWGQNGITWGQDGITWSQDGIT